MVVSPAMTSCEENIKVLVRVRPLLLKERGSDAVVESSNDSKVVRIETETHNVRAKFDHVFGTESTQEDVYSQVRFAADSVAQGLNATIFAYGQTGSGKSYTMFGPEDDLSIYGSGEAPSESMGVIPRAVREVIRASDRLQLEARAQGEDTEVSVFCSFMQIYNDQPYDLLRDPLRQQPLEVHENTRSKEVYVVGLSEYAVRSLSDCLALLEQGDEQRACRQTAMNDVSSRSHSVFQMVVERRSVNSGKLVRSKLNLVDLAGSEKWSSHEMLEKGHLSEMNNINSSLHTLGRCIAALTDPESSHVPFRDSKLTRILMDALGGNSRTCIIATLSSAEKYLEESISTLKFADRAKRVMQHARVVEQREVSVQLVESLEDEIKHLRTVLAAHGIDPTEHRTSSGSNEKDSNQNDPHSNGGEEHHIDIVERQKQALVSLQEKLFQANDKIKALVQSKASASNANSSESNDGEKQPKQPSAPSPRSANAIAENNRFKNALANIKIITTSFFKFEIEEDEFQEEFERHLAPVQPLLSSAQIQPSVRRNKIPSPRFTARGSTSSSKSTNAPPLVTSNSMTTSATLAQTLKEKQKELAKHKKLQQYLADKAQKELERIEAERKREEDSDATKKSRDKQFSKHASLVKQKLIRLKTQPAADHDLASASNDSANIFPLINASAQQQRPESRSGALSDSRPLSRQTIFELDDEH